MARNLKCAWLATAALAGLVFGAEHGAEQPSVASLAQRLADATVVLPNGSMALVLAPLPGTANTDAKQLALLTRERLETCIETVSLADAWPIAWLVVQWADVDFDLVMRVELSDEGEVTAPDFLFAAPRREWQVGDLKRVVKETTGRNPPRKGLGNLVIQGFSTKVVTKYVYELPEPDGEERGLYAMLPEGSLIREARAVDLGDAGRHTLALVLEHATFVPSQCRDCASEIFGHADSGTVSLVLTNEKEIVDRIDLTPNLRGVDGTPLLPRYHCDADRVAPRSAQELLASGDPIALLNLIDDNGDGKALELVLPAEHIDCNRYLNLIARIRPGGSGLEIVGTRQVSR